MFEVGTIIRLLDKAIVPPKVKYSVIVGGNSDEIATILINSDIHIDELGQEQLQALCYPIASSICPFLIQESFIDCSDIFVRKKSELNTILQKEPGRREMVLPKKQLDDIMKIVRNARSISNETKHKFGII